MHLVRAITLSALCITLLVGCSSREPEWPADKRYVVVFLGDSLTDGHGMDLEHTYPSLIQNKINTLGWPIDVINAGVSGETTGDGLKRLPELLNQQIDVLVVALGANDALHNVPLENTRRDIEQLLTQARTKKPSTKLMLVGVHFPWPLSKNTDALKPVYKDLAREHDAVWIPSLLKGVVGKRELNTDDNIHPNRAGHVVMAETVWKKLKPVLEHLE